MGASNYGQFKFLLPEFSQMIFSPGPLIYKLRQGLKDYKSRDYLLLTGDPAIIGVACSIVSDITNGKFKLLKWINKRENIILLKSIYMRKEKLMSIKQSIKMKETINFEADQQDAMKRTDNIQSLADQVERLEDIISDIESAEEKLKEWKKKRDHISGEVIPTMMSEMGLAELKLHDGSHLKVSTSYKAHISEANKEAAYNWAS